jgi:mono/diheme cytochrome c family protein
MKHVFLIVLVATFAISFPSLLATISSTSAGALPAVDSAQLYAKQCASCHGKDGRAKTLKGKLKHARNLTDAEWQEKVSEERIFNSIMNGKGKMPAYGKKLSQDQIEALASYIRAFNR